MTVVLKDGVTMGETSGKRYELCMSFAICQLHAKVTIGDSTSSSCHCVSWAHGKASGIAKQSLAEKDTKQPDA